MLVGSGTARGVGMGDERVADVVERAVDRLDEQVDGGRLTRAGETSDLPLFATRSAAHWVSHSS